MAGGFGVGLGLVVLEVVPDMTPESWEVWRRDRRLVQRASSGESNSEGDCRLLKVFRPASLGGSGCCWRRFAVNRLEVSQAVPREAEERITLGVVFDVEQAK